MRADSAVDATETISAPLPAIAECYRSRQGSSADAAAAASSFQPFDDVLTSSARRPRAGDANIFFHETTCRQPNTPARLNARQACAIESAARAHPNGQIFVLFASPTGSQPPPPATSPNSSAGGRFDAVPLLRSRYPNVHWRNVDVWRYADRTPVPAAWLQSRGQPNISTLFASAYHVSHLSDLLRVLSVYRFGGAHLDLDFVVRAKLPAFVRASSSASSSSVPTVWVADESPGELGSSVLAATGARHPMLAHALRRYADEYRAGEWAFNGPALLTRVLRTSGRCGDRGPWRCRPDGGAVVQNTSVYFAVPYPRWRWLLEPQRGAEVMRLVRDSVAVHMWNKLSAGTPVRMGEGSAYERLAREFCPVVVGGVEADAMGGWVF